MILVSARAKTMGITQKEALAELVKEDLETMENAEKKFKKLEEKIKSRRRRKPKI